MFNFQLKKGLIHVKEYAMQLFCYLTCFGMARSSTGLPNTNLNSFTGFVNAVKKPLIEISKINFLDICEKDRRYFNKYVEKLKTELQGIKVSDTDTMISKILLGVSGKFLAVDRFVKKSYKELHKRSSNDLFTTYLNIHETYYQQGWDDQIKHLPQKYRYTQKGNLIPQARLIDMALWYHGQK